MLLNTTEYPIVANILELKTKISNRKQELAGKRLALQYGDDPRRVQLPVSHDFGIRKLKDQLKPLMQFYRQQVRAKKRAA